MRDALAARMANQNGRTHQGRDAQIPSFHRDDDRDRAMRDDDRGFEDRYDPRERGWRPEERGERGERGDWRDRRGDQRFDDGGDSRFEDRGWASPAERFPERFPERFSESDRGREPLGGRDRDNRSERNELRVDIHGYRTPGLEPMPRQDQLLRGAYRDHDESNRDLGYRSPGRPFREAEQRARDLRGDAGGAGALAGERMPRRGPHHGKGPVGFQRSDERIKELVCEALTDDGEVDATRIEVSVKGGEVTLTGTVEDRPMKRRAEDCVEAVPGVKDVHNQLRIGDQPAGGAHRSGHGPDRPEKGDRAERHDRHDRPTDPSDKKHRPS